MEHEASTSQTRLAKSLASHKKIELHILAFYLDKFSDTNDISAYLAWGQV